MVKRHESLIRLILSIYRTSQIHIVPSVSEFDIGRGQWYFLNQLLLEADGISQEELSRKMVVDSAHTARAIKILEEKGFVYREKDSEDGRKKNIFITDKSLKIKEDYHNIYKDLNKILVKDFTSEEIELLISLLFRMEDNIKSYVENAE